MEKIKNLFEGKQPQRIFLWLAIPAILIFIFIIPALQGWDESTHFLRAYQVSTGDFVSERYGQRAGGQIPVNVSNMNDVALNDLILSSKSELTAKAHLAYYKTYLKQNQPGDQTVRKYFAGSAVYSPLSYAPQSLGILLARTFKLPLLSYIFIGRLFNAAVFIALAYWAIRIAPKGRWALAAIALLPTSLTAAASLSPDALVIGSALLLTGIFLAGLLRSAPLAAKYMMAILAAVLVLSLTKQTYFILALLPLCLPKRVFGSAKKYLAWNLCFLVVAVSATAIWFSQVGDTAKYTYLDSRPAAHISVSEQESLILHKPLHYLGIAGWGVIGKSNPQLVQIPGALTWKGILLPYYVLFLIYLGLVLSFWSAPYESGPRTPVITKRQRILARYWPISLALAGTLLIYTSLYIYFSPVGANLIEGVQGRYLIPFLGLLLPWVILRRLNVSPISFSKLKLNNILVAIFIIQILAAIIAVFTTNYIPHIRFV